jgi:hypothetical protein
MGNFVKLVFGVTVANYPRGNKTTGDVAQLLEDKYHVMGTFAQLYEGNICAMLESSVARALETQLRGVPLATAPFEGACEKIDNLFRQAIDVKAYDGLIEGVPTEASIQGVRSHLKNNPNNTEFKWVIDKKTGKRKLRRRNKKKRLERMNRASFFDTGQYTRNFKSWVEE